MHQQRRYDLDWLRIILFLLLILYHVGMFYVPWGWHVKSVYAPVEWLTVPMRILNPWRIPALFIISGIALRFALDKAASHSAFLSKRTVRLLLPILFGMALICAPQAYYELKQAGVQFESLSAFYLGYLSPPWASPENWNTITPTWNHLWYVVYVLLLSTVIVSISALFRGRFDALLNKLADWFSERPAMLLLLPMVVSFFILWIFKHSVGAVQMLWGDWHRLANSLWLLLFGYSIAKHAHCWRVFWLARWIMLGMAVILGIVLTLANLEWYWVGDSFDPHYYITRSFYSWSVMLALLGFVQLLGRGSDNIRNYLSDAVFPYYVLHQTIIVVLGFWLTARGLSFPAESMVLIAGTAVLTAFIHHFIVRSMGRFSVLLGGRGRVTG